jgi:hypothetical protein
MRHPTLLVVGLSLGARLLAAQGAFETGLTPAPVAGPIAVEGLSDLRRIPKLRFCDRSEMRLGYLDAEGEVTYVIPLSGRPDTSSIHVVSVERVAEASLRSAALRYLSTCRFDVARTRSGPAPALVRQRLKFSSRRIQRAYVPPTAPVPAHPDSTDPGLWDVFASELDELPRPEMCRPPDVDPGRIQIRFVVDTAGAPDPASVEVVAASPAKLGERAVKLATACRFAPGRAAGVPVRVRLSQVFLIK